MNFADHLLNRLFLSDNTSLKKVLLKEMIKRDELFLSKADNWIKNKEHLKLLGEIKENKILRDSKPDADVNFYVYHQNNSNGFYFNSSPNYKKEEYTYLIQFFINTLEKLDYYVSNSLREVVEEDNELKTIEQFYLKPKLKYRRELPYNQLFGNIIIEHRMIEDKTILLKFMASTYSDSNYKKAYHYDDLMGELLLL